jgi:hypothetical protein
MWVFFQYQNIIWCAMQPDKKFSPTIFFLFILFTLFARQESFFTFFIYSLYSQTIFLTGFFLVSVYTTSGDGSGF